jgi:hypothetical protein
MSLRHCLASHESLLRGVLAGLSGSIADKRVKFSPVKTAGPRSEQSQH